MGLRDFLSAWVGGTIVVAGAALLAPTIIGGSIGFFIGSSGKDRTGGMSAEIVARISEGLIFVIPGMFLGAIVNVIFSIPLLAVAIVCGLLFFIGFPVGSAFYWISH